MNLRILTLVALVCILAGCDAVGTETGGGRDGANLFVINQGNFGDGNGSVSVVEPVADPPVRSTITDLGSILQSATLNDGELYLMANSANRIDIFDAATHEQSGQIENIVSPRYMIVDGRTAYVTSLYGGANSFTGGMVNVIDLVDEIVHESIQVGNNPEGLARVGDRLYVANHGFGGGSTLSVVDLTVNAVIDTVDVGCDGPRFLFADAQDDVFVICTGQTIYDGANVVGETDGAVRILDGDTGEILTRIVVDGRVGTEAFGQDAYFDEGGDRIYVVKDGSSLMVLNTETNSLATTLGPFDDAAIGAVAADTEAGRIYLTHVAGYTESGRLTIHSLDGAQIGTPITVGIAPSHIVLRR